MKHLIIHSSNFKYLQSSFKEWLDIQEFATRTVISFPILLQEFFYFVEQKNIKHVSKVTHQHALDFKLHLQYRINAKQKNGCISNQTVNGILQAINCFERYYNQLNDYHTLDIYQEYLPIDTPVRTILTQSEVKAMYDATFEIYPNKHGSSEMGQRDRVILGLLYCGLRRNELLNLNLSDINFSDKNVIVRFGKGNKQRYVPIPNQILEDIRTYIQSGRYWFTEHHHQVNVCYKHSFKKVVTDDDHEALILNQNGKRMMSFGSRLNYLTTKAGINKCISAHSVRHSCATHWHQNGLPLEDIQKILGHSSIELCRCYVHLAEELENELKHLEQ